MLPTFSANHSLKCTNTSLQLINLSTEGARAQSIICVSHTRASHITGATYLSRYFEKYSENILIFFTSVVAYSVVIILFIVDYIFHTLLFV